MTSRALRGEAARLLEEQTGCDTAEAAIQQLTARLLEEAGLDEPPVDLEILASFQGIASIRSCAMDSAGRLLPQNGTLVIEVNADHTEERRRFTIAHEIGHTLLPTYARQPIDDAATGTWPESGTRWEEEYLCDVAAAHLLMDRRQVRALLDRYVLSIEVLPMAARAFRVSLHAMARQIADLGTEPIAFVVWEIDSASRDFVVAAFHASATFPRAHRFPHGALTEGATPMDEVTASKRPVPLKRDFLFEFQGNTQPIWLHSESISTPFGGSQRVISLLRPSRYPPRHS